MEAREYAQGLRDFADWVEANEELISYELGRADREPEFRFNIYALDPNQLRDYVRALGRAEKNVDDSYFKVTRRFGPVEVMAYTARELVCERVVTGTREVTKEVRDQDLVRQAIEQIPAETVTEIVEDVEWVCEPSILAAAHGEAVV
jgi:hypothetical protein